jgi:CheY-like chemotaxis protein
VLNWLWQDACLGCLAPYHNRGSRGRRAQGWEAGEGRHARHGVRACDALPAAINWLACTPQEPIEIGLADMGEHALVQKPTVLVVEDEILIRYEMGEGLRDEGFDVIEASGADEALLVMASGPQVDIVLTDIRMPGSIDGLGLAAAVKDLHPCLPVVVLSSHLPPDQVCRADRFLSKPVLFLTLLDTINELIAPRWTNQKEHGSTL